MTKRATASLRDGLRAAATAGALALALVLAPLAEAAEGGDIRVKFGRHADFVRLVFKWPQRLAYEVELEPLGATVRFADAQGFDFSLVDGGRRVSVAQLDDEKARISYDRARSLKHFRHGPYVVVDLYETDAGAPLPSAPADGDATAASERPTPSYPPLPPRRDGAEAVAAAPPAEAQPAPDPPAALADPTAVQAALPPEPPKPSTVSLSAKGPPDLADIPPPDLKHPMPPPSPQTASEDRLTVKQTDGTIELGLFGPDIRAAAYTRAGGHWIVLDRPIQFNLDEAAAIGLDILQLPYPDKTVIYIDIGATPELSAWRDETGWRFTLSATPGIAHGLPVQISRARSSGEGGRLIVGVPLDVTLLRIVDPEVGDALFVAAVSDVRAVETAHNGPDVAVLETALGVVVQPKSEGVTVRQNTGILEVRKRGGLLMSDPERDILTAEQVRPSAIDLAEWRGTGAYINAVAQRLGAMNGVAAFGRNVYRLDLAKFSIARGYAAEAIGYLQSIAMSDRGAEDQVEFRMLQGIAHAMLGQHDLAAPHLDQPALVGDPNVEIWRAMALSEQGKHRFASAKFRRYWSATTDWPARHRARLTLAAGGSALAAGLPDVAERFLQQEDPSRAPSGRELAAFAVVSGGVKAARSDIPGAIREYEVAIEKGGPDTRAKATLAMVRMEYANGTMDGATASERLRRLQMNWRGDRTEYETLKTWGEIQMELSGFREGFWALNEAAHLFAERYDTTDVRAMLTAGFKRAFVDGGADDLPPLEAVALFQDFKELAPAGRQGDLALANFARRLMALDLVDEADGILDHLVSRRLKGAARAELAGELAGLRASRRLWRGALAALDQVADVAASKRVLRANRNVRAEALAGLGRIDEALALLEDPDDRDAMWLRAALAWRAADWISARAGYRRLASAGAFDGEMLSPDAAATVVRWAVSASMLKNQPEVQEIAQRYAGRIAPNEKALAAALKALATPGGGTGGAALAAARLAIENAEALAGAVGDYRSARQG